MEAGIFMCTTAPVMYSLCSAKADAIFGALQSCLGTGTAGHVCAATHADRDSEWNKYFKSSLLAFQLLILKWSHVASYDLNDTSDWGLHAFLAEGPGGGVLLFVRPDLRMRRNMAHVHEK